MRSSYTSGRLINLNISCELNVLQQERWLVRILREFEADKLILEGVFDVAVELDENVFVLDGRWVKLACKFIAI